MIPTEHSQIFDFIIPQTDNIFTAITEKKSGTGFDKETYYIYISTRVIYLFIMIRKIKCMSAHDSAAL